MNEKRYYYINILYVLYNSLFYILLSNVAFRIWVNPTVLTLISVVTEIGLILLMPINFLILIRIVSKRRKEHFLQLSNVKTITLALSSLVNLFVGFIVLFIFTLMALGEY